MTRLAVSILPILAFLSGCAGPIETRVQSLSSVEISQFSSFDFSEAITPNDEISQLLKQQLREALLAKGLSESKQSSLLLEFSVADRPASIAIRLGEGKKEKTVANAKEKKLFQSCADREHRLIISLVEKDSGTQHYRGIASEYHCKASIQQSLPHLIQAALADFGSYFDAVPRQRVFSRHGLE